MYLGYGAASASIALAWRGSLPRTLQSQIQTKRHLRVFLSAFWGIGYGAVLMAVIALIVSYVNPAQENVSLYLVAIVIGTGLLFFIRAANTRHTSIKTSNAGRSLQRFHRRFCRR